MDPRSRERSKDTPPSDSSGHELHPVERFLALSSQMFCAITLDGYFDSLNPAFEHTLGYETGGLHRVPFLRLVHADDWQRTVDAVERFATGAVSVEIENRYLCRDGSYRLLAW